MEPYCALLAQLKIVMIHDQNHQSSSANVLCHIPKKNCIVFLFVKLAFNCSETFVIIMTHVDAIYRQSIK